jgi:beta-lactamase class A
VGKWSIQPFVNAKVQFIKQLYAERRKVFFVYAGIAIVLCLYLVITIIQLAYSPDKALYGAKVGTENVQGKSKAEVVDVAKRMYGDTKFRVIADGSELLTVNAPQLDSSFNTDDVAEEVVAYSVGERFIPLSLWLKKPSVETVPIETTPEIVQTVLQEKVGESGRVEPVNAALAVNAEGAVAITPEKNGAKVNREEVGALFTNTEAPLGGSVEYQSAAEILPAAITTSDLASAQRKAQAVIDKSVAFSLGEERVAITSKDLGTWLTFSYDNKDAQIGVDSEKLTAALEAQFGAKVNVAPGKSMATLLDGVEIGRTEGLAGRGIDYAVIASRMISAFASETTTSPEIAVTSKLLAPTVSYTYTYSKTLAGLQAYVRQISADSDTRVSVRQLGGNGWSAGARETEQTVSASTYKLFVALYVLREIAAGTITYNDEVLGTTVRACLEKMIVNSDNACAEAFLAKYGATKINGVLWSLGFSRQTSLTSSDGLAKTTTADLNKALQDLEQGTIIKGEGRAFLLDLMGRQVYRQGVPAGSSGAVKDKVGFIQDYLNDAAIVSHPKGTYVISIMTKGQSWAKIAEITRQIESIMYP